MKRILIPIFFIAVLASCTQEFEELNVLSDELQTNNAKTADGVWISLNNGAYAQKTPEGYIMEGDIILSESQIEALTGSVSRSGFLSDINLRWPYNQVYYSVADNFAKSVELNEAIEHYHQYTHIRFLPKNSLSNNYIEFVNHPTSTFSSLGMLGGKQYINVAGWAQTYSIAHEIGHAIGLIHEQSRFDRDNYIVIHWDNIKDNKENNFTRMTTEDSSISTVTTNYDYESIMHYPSIVSDQNFAVNTELPVITKINGGYIGVNRHLSKEDIIAINNLYPINIEISGDEYCLLPNFIAGYSIWGNIPELATIQWEIYPTNSGTIISGQGTKHIQARITSNDIQYVQAVITYPKTEQVFTKRLNVQASYAPIVSDIEMFKYCQGDGGYTLKAISSDGQAICSWNYEGGNAVFTDLTFPDDASFLDTPSLYKEIYFYTTGIYNITVNASNSYGSSSFTKSGLYVFDSVSSSGFILSPNPVVDKTEVDLTIIDKMRSLKNQYIISVFKEDQLVLYYESEDLNNKLDVSTLQDGEYLVVLEKDGKRTEQKLFVKKTINKQNL